MVYEFKLPDIGEGVHEGEIVRWMVKQGDKVGEDQPIVEVMTDKATVELTAPRAGTIASVNAKEGDVIEVGTVFVTIEEAGDDATPKPAPPPAKAAVGPAAERQEKTLFEGQAQVELVRRRKKPSTPGSGAPSQGNGQVVHPAGKPVAAPAVRRRAREQGVDLWSVAGSGPAGRITQDDLAAFATTPAAAPQAVVSVSAAPVTPEAAVGWTSPQYQPGQEIPYRGLRRKIAEAMRHSKSTASHFTYVEEVDATELVALRDSSREIAAKRGIPLTFLPFIVKATVAALKAFPLVNARLDEEKGVIRCLTDYHIGIAAATEAGLIVPVVKNADQKSVFQIAQEIQQLSRKTRDGTATREELTGSTFTITSLGKMGGLLATPIINHPEVAIMGVHAIKQRGVVRDGQVVAGQVMNLSFSFDHGVVDGAYGADFAQTLIRFLEDPKLLLLETA